MTKFLDYGIIVDLNGPTQQKLVCPKCDLRKGGTKDRDLSVSLQMGIWHCFNSNCEWSGSLKHDKKVIVDYRFRSITLTSFRISPTLFKNQ